MSNDDGFNDTESAYEALVFIGALIAMGIVAVVAGVWACLKLWN